MDKKPKSPKAPSMKKVARSYKKNSKVDNSGWTGARYFSADAKPYGTGSLTRKNTYKPSSKQITLGGTRKSNPTTIRKRGKA